MAYTPHTWLTGETITADKLNNIDMALRRAASGIQAQYLGTQAIGGTSEFIGALDSVRASQGDGFSLGSNEILCKYAGVVAVSAFLYCASGFTAGDLVLLAACKNSDTIVRVSRVMAGTGQESIVIPTVLVTVSTGDALKIKLRNAAGARGVVGSADAAQANGLTAHYLP